MFDVFSIAEKCNPSVSNTPKSATLFNLLELELAVEDVGIYFLQSSILYVCMSSIRKK